ncbi:MAG: hypothetical protein AAF982_08070 [Pseudomonadota bacterium]
MGDLTDLEQRISVALDRIAARVNDRLAGDAGAMAADQARLAQALEEEKTANAQLEERLRVVRDRADAAIAQWRQKVERLQQQLVEAEKIMVQVRGVNERLREANAALRSRNEDMVGEPHLINQAMVAELEALRVARSADLAEMDAILDEMKPLVGEA